ncbi:glutamate-5-semialdehyde dehydrogenase [Olivibacter sp. SDN3]|uniref:glutamate-5-semialdehyde dehydrogenase n=1 Tax=Olivibacter sp. SDN3 TaxID=2764720 RepID=UPI0016518F22|nr:glutamate-5-semialdehyde dehydrogenase [Olivibacter sp. SDN3]QNL48888.1 glutamate-5-semialdehyde dehydrogenase [Olivibacter sp. SDN3]
MSYLSAFEKAREARQEMVYLSAGKINEVLQLLATEIVSSIDFLLRENQKDLEKMSISDPKYDRLKLTSERIKAIARDIENIAELNSPIGEVLEKRLLANGLDVKKVRVPLGVVSVIYEARPNVTLDVFALCFKTGNVTILKGGSDAEFSNKAIMTIIHKVLVREQVSPAVVCLLPVDRAATACLLNAVDYVDVLIPRGSQQLINYVRENSKVPVIETGAGIVHTYFDVSGNLEKGRAIIDNAKTRRVSVCNALDCLLIHSDRLLDLVRLLEPLAEKGVELFADSRAYEVLAAGYPKKCLQPADDRHYGMEFLSLKMAVKTVDSLEEAIAHITAFSSKHSEAIIAEDEHAINDFLTAIDAAAVYANTSTAFTDGAQFGLGAEIGISTQKLHARGPMGLAELTSYKWIVVGTGQVRV